MPTISIICFLFILILLLTGLRKDADFLAPARIFGIVWLFAIALVQFKFSRLQFEWSNFGWIMLLLGLISFLLGTYISFSINVSKSYLIVKNIREKIRSIELDEKKLFNIIIIFFVIYIVCFTLEYMIEGYIPLFTSEPDKARRMFGVFGLHLIVDGVNIILFLIIQYFIMVKHKINKKIILTLVFIISAATFLLLLQRYNFFLLLIMVICFYYYAGKKINLKVVISSILLLVGIVIGIESLRVAKFAQAYFFTTSEMKFSYKYAILAEPYMYIVMNLENFVKNYQFIPHHTWGIFTSDFILALVGVKHWVLEYFNVVKFPHYIGGYNTFPFYWAYYYDFGIPGLAVIPFVIGFIISEIYYYLHRKPNLVNLALYSVGFAVIIISYSSDPLTRLDMMFNFIVIVLIQKFILKQSLSLL